MIPYLILSLPVCAQITNGISKDKLKTNAATALKNSSAPLTSIISLPDSSFENELSSTAEKAFETIKNKLDGLSKQLTQINPLHAGVGIIDKKALAALKKFSIGDCIFTSDVNIWKDNAATNLYLQDNINFNLNAAGIPVTTSLIENNSFYYPGSFNRFTYKLQYDRNAFIDKLGIDKNGIKQQLQSTLNLDKQLDYQRIIKDSYKSNPVFNKIISATNTNWEHILQLPEDQFKKLYNKDALKQQLANAEKLEKYYEDYAKHHADSLVNAKLQNEKAKLEELRKMEQVYQKLYRLKASAEKLYQRLLALKKIYDDRLKLAIDQYDVVKDAINNSNDLSGFQKFMLKVKGIQIGQHTISTNNLALQNFQQYGVSFKYETEKNYLLLTKGSQEKIEAPGRYFQQTTNEQGAVNEYYQFYSRYKLTGVSVGKKSGKGNFHSVSLMNFDKADKYPYPSLFAKNVEVFTLSEQLNSIPSQKLAFDISKSIIKQNSVYNNGSVASSSGFIETMAAQVKYSYENPFNQDAQKLDLLYCSEGYNNPGLNGGLSRPGIQAAYRISKKLSKRIKADNQLNYYGFKYGSNVSLRSFRDKINVTYKIKKVRVGVMLNGSDANQIQYDPKVTVRSHTLDFLGTIQSRQRFSDLFINWNGGLGYGFSRQENFNATKNWSFYLTSNLSYKSFSLDLNTDRFNTRNTEIYANNSATLILNSTFNFQGLFGYTGKNGNFFQVGMQYSKLDNDQIQLFISGNTEWHLFKKISFSAGASLPVSSPATGLFMNNIFNSKLTYNITGHDK